LSSATLAAPGAAQPAAASTGTPVLELRSISKRFPGVVALDDVGFDLRAGEVHVLVGENGAGKSTLVKILSGIYQPDAGAILLDGEPVVLRDPHAAQKLGIVTVHQELNLVPHLDVGRNISLGREPTRGPGGIVDWRAVYAIAHERLAALGLDLDPKRTVSTLGVALQQMVEIAKALAAEARVLILDEPTAALTAEESEQLFAIVDTLRAKGTAIVLISHHLEDATRAGDRATVLRDGRWVATRPMVDLPIPEMIRLMVGRELTQQFPKADIAPGPVAIKVEGLSRAGVLDGVSFEVRRGEVLGLAGLVGAGRSETARAIFGIDPVDAGRIEIDGQPVRIDHPRQAIRQGVALLPEDRKQQGLVLLLSVADNIALAAPEKLGALAGLVPPSARFAAARRFVDALRIKTPGPRQRAMNLSGGNQQKIVLAKWLLTEADIFIFDEPTRGIDVGAKVEVYKLMNGLLERGAAIVMISSELPEVLGMSDRILVLRDGRVVAEFDRAAATQEAIMAYAAGGTELEPDTEAVA
jgi:ribose transport system ATP-binding protein